MSLILRKPVIPGPLPLEDASHNLAIPRPEPPPFLLLSPETRRRTTPHLEFRVEGSGYRFEGSGFRVQGSRSRVSGFRLQGPGSRAHLSQRRRTPRAPPPSLLLREQPRPHHHAHLGRRRPEPRRTTPFFARAAALHAGPHLHAGPSVAMRGHVTMRMPRVQRPCVAMRRLPPRSPRRARSGVPLGRVRQRGRRA